MPASRRDLNRLRNYARSPETIEADKLLRTPQWKRLKGMLIAGKFAECWLCNCSGVLAPADSLDHVIPRTERPELAFTLSNLRPVHHSECPICKCRCNSIRGMGSPERARRIIDSRKEKLGLEVRKSPPATEGREW